MTREISCDPNQRRRRAPRSAIEPAVGAVSFQSDAAHISRPHGRRPCRHFNQYVRFWLTPWRRTDEHLPLSHIAEVTHTRGLFWDAISVESSGGINPLIVSGVSKSPARYFVEHVRERLNVSIPCAAAALNASAPAIAGAERVTPPPRPSRR